MVQEAFVALPLFSHCDTGLHEPIIKSSATHIASQPAMPTKGQKTMAAFRMLHVVSANQIILIADATVMLAL
ncbi:MAG: hypothetical protein ACRBM6_16815 [Geminicoccales bacterium]